MVLYIFFFREVRLTVIIDTITIIFLKSEILNQLYLKFLSLEDSGDCAGIHYMRINEHTSRHLNYYTINIIGNFIERGLFIKNGLLR